MKGNKELNCGDFDYCILNQDMAVYKWIDNEAVKVIPISMELNAMKLLQPKKMGQRNDLAV